MQICGKRNWTVFTYTSNAIYLVQRQPLKLTNIRPRRATNQIQNITILSVTLKENLYSSVTLVQRVH